MLDNNQIAAASKTLHDHWRAGTKLDALDTSLRPRDRAEGYAIQAAIENYSTGKLFGWKIAAISEAGQIYSDHFNVVQFGAGITPDMLTWSRTGAPDLLTTGHTGLDLTIAIAGTSDLLTVQNDFQNRTGSPSGARPPRSTGRSA